MDNNETIAAPATPPGAQAEPLRAAFAEAEASAGNPDPDFEPVPEGARAAEEPMLGQEAPNPEALLPMMASLMLENHVQTIARAHPDWEEIAAGQDLPAWIDTHPDYLAQPLRQVAEAGSATEVVDLLDRFKDATGRRLPSPKEAQRLLSAMSASAVPSRTGGPPAGQPDENDFNAAWKTATKANR